MSLANEILLRSNSTDPDSCWRWTSYMRNKRCPGIRIGRRVMLAHRVSYECFVAPIPKGMNVLHSCDDPMCVNPSHLFVGTQEENIHDMVDKGRQKRSRLGLPYGARYIKEGNGYAAVSNRDSKSVYLGFYKTAEEASSVASAYRDELIAGRRRACVGK